MIQKYTSWAKKSRALHEIDSFAGIADFAKNLHQDDSKPFQIQHPCKIHPYVQVQAQ